jgi:hypothetical protein
VLAAFGLLLLEHPATTSAAATNPTDPAIRTVRRIACSVQLVPGGRDERTGSF